MCTINFNITSTGDSYNSIEAQYKLQGSQNWIPFTTNINSPQTPGITTEGTYDLRVRGVNSSGNGNWVQSTFQIGCPQIGDPDPVVTGVTFVGEDKCCPTST